MDELLNLFEQAYKKVEISLSTFAQKQQRSIADPKNNNKMEQQIKFSPDSKIQHDMVLSTTILDPDSSTLDSIPENKYTEAYEQKINNLKMNSVSSRRKDQLFKRFRRQQQQKIVQRRKQLEQKFSFNEAEKDQGQFSLKRGQKQQKFTLKCQDFQKLKPQTDLNDTILDNYLKILQLMILPPQVQQKTFIFSSFFMGKLLGDALQGQFTVQKQSQAYINKCKKKVRQIYPNIKRWTRRIDLFNKQIVVIPINSFKHWNCMIILAPHTLINQTSMCKILYFDSMCEKKMIFPQAFKTYLELELAERKGIQKDLQFIKTHQLLVPRQTNTHDCGLYTLCYIQFFLSNRELLQTQMQIISNKNLLRLFPRSIIFTMRECLRYLYYNLLKKQDKQQVIKKYINTREQIIKNSIPEIDYDEINQRQFKKYYRINAQSCAGQEQLLKQDEIQFLCKIKFYLDCEVNHYEKDR